MLDIDIRKWIIGGLLILHIAWIGNHLRWVAGGQINPWKLGGYAMYTVPSPDAAVRVFDVNVPEKPLRVKLTQYNAATRFTNILRAFRCADVPAAALIAFYEENSGLIGRNLAFVYREREFVRIPPSIKPTLQGLVNVSWRDTQSFTYTNRFCGNERTGTATFPFAPTTALP